MHFTKILPIIPAIPGIVMASNTVEEGENIGGILLLGVVFLFFYIYGSVFGKKKDARTKTGYKDNRVPMRFIPRFFASLVLTIVTVVLIVVLMGSMASAQ